MLCPYGNVALAFQPSQQDPPKYLIRSLNPTILAITYISNMSITTGPSSSNSETILNALTTALGNDATSLLQPGSAEYERDNGSYFSAFENELKPYFIAKPATVEQVQGLVRALRPHLVAGSCRIAVRGGGHTPFAGSANIQDGVTIDMRRLKGVVLSPDKATVEMAVGETWSSVYAELEKHGLTVAGGRMSRVCVAGNLLGGE